MTVVLAVLAGVLALLVPVALADQTYDDPAADSGGCPWTSRPSPSPTTARIA